MSIINHSRRTGTLEQVIGCHNDGSLLQGEADMYKRILKDCESSDLHWHLWYDLSLPISYAGQSEIQIDFLLICEKGAIVLEVKGGQIDVINGIFYYVHNKGTYSKMNRTPFEQARNYKWALLNHNVLNGDQIIVDYAVAFPHQCMNYTSTNADIDLSFWLWDKTKQDNPEYSFANFCESILDEAQNKLSKKKYLTDKELEKAVQVLSPTLIDKSRYTQSTLSEVLTWLNIENLDILEGLSKNKRLLIEGGPGTGKTTMAKAFIKKHKGLKGLYLCQNILLQAQIKEDLVQEDLYNCNVNTFGRFINCLTSKSDECNTWSAKEMKEALSSSSNYGIYDYVIIDEAQDIADQGIDVLINYLTSAVGNGMSTGSYLIFYDLEQGYNSKSRNIEEFVSSYLSYAAHYTLNENKRIITNRQIINIANGLLALESQEEYIIYLNKINEDSINNLRLTFVDDKKHLSRAFRSAVKQSEDVQNTVVLVHSAFKHIYVEQESIYDSLSDKVGIHILDEDDIHNPIKSSIPFTSILKYKGLETHKVILVIPHSCQTSDFRNFLFEVYVGMTRAMMELQIIIF